MKDKQAQFLVKVITHLSLKASKESNQTLDDEETRLCKEIEESFRELITKIASKKEQTIQLVRQKFQSMRAGQTQTNPLGEQLLSWKNKVMRKIDPMDFFDENRNMSSFDIINEDTKKIATTIKDWTQNMSSQDTTIDSGYLDLKLDTSLFENALQSLDGVLTSFSSSRGQSLNSIGKERNTHNFLKTPPSTYRKSEERTFQESTSKKSIEELAPELFDIFTKGDTIELKAMGSSTKDSSKASSDLVKYWKDSSIKGIKIEIPSSKINSNTESCLGYFFKKHDTTKLHVDLNIDVFCKDFGEKMESIFKYIQNVKGITQLSFKVTETANMTTSAREELLLNIFKMLKELKHLEKLDLKLRINNIDHSVFLNVVKGISVCVKLKDIQLSIKPGSPITDESISYVQVVWMKLLHLQKFSLGLQSCNQISNKGLQDFLKTVIQLKSMKEIHLDVKGCWNIKGENINVPEDCKKTFDESSILIKRSF